MRARAGWWFRPDFIINELNINSAVSKPWHDDVLPLGTNTNYTMQGYAYTGAVRAARGAQEGGAHGRLAEHARLCR
jgi:nitrate reductase (NAD(P)H)